MPTKKQLPTIILVALVVLLGGLAAYFYYQSSASGQEFGAMDQEETEKLVKKVGKLIALPEGEVPTIATVSEPEKLRSQPFFANAQAGDKVLIYSQARKAYLYDPVSNRLREVAPLNIGDVPSTENTPASASGQ